MKVLVTGSNGFVASYTVAQLLHAGYEVVAISRGTDISTFGVHQNYHFISMNCADAFALHDVFEWAKPDIVIHCAAMSRPDECEQKQAEAFDVNVMGTLQLLLNAETYQSFFIFLSSDFIFDGNRGLYTEDDIPAPISYYGKTKWQAEEAVMEYQHGWAIIRTSFVYGKPLYGRGNFITMIAEKIKAKTAFNVVNDQERTPVYVANLAEAIVSVAEKRHQGVYHIAGEELLTPYQMSLAVSDYLGIADHLLKPVTKENFKELAERPLKGGLSIKKAIGVLNYKPTRFIDGIHNTLVDNK